MKKFFYVFTLAILMFSISSALLCSFSASNNLTTSIEAYTSKGVKNTATSKGTLWSTQSDVPGLDIEANTYVYLYYTKSGKETYYADYKTAQNINAGRYYNMEPSVAKWSTDGSSNFHSKHFIHGLENGVITSQNSKNISVSEFGK